MGSDKDSHSSDEEKREQIQDAEITIKVSAPRCSKNCRTCCENFFILMFEFTGTFMLSAIWAGGTAAWFPMWMGFFVVLIMGANISGAHFNPCVTAAFMFRRDKGKFKALHGLFYILFQILGAICGMIMAANLLLNKGAIVGIGKCGINGNWWFTQAMFREFLGSTILVFMYLT